MLTLFHAPQSRSSRIIWLLEELGAPYELHPVAIRYSDGTGSGPDRANPHPDGKVPALDHDGTVVTESAAVATYLCELHPESDLGRHPGDRDRGPFLAWLAWAECEFGPAMFTAAYGGTTSPGSVEAVFARLTTALENGPYLMGERFSAVDVMVGAGLMWMRGVLPASESIDAYVASLQARPALARAFGKDGEKPSR